MKDVSFLLLLILFWGFGLYLGYDLKKCDCDNYTVDTVFVPGDTFVIDKPKPAKAYKASSHMTVALDSSKKDIIVDRIPDVRKTIDVCDSIRVYEYSDTSVTIIDSVQGVLLQQKIIFKPAIREIRTTRKDSLVFQRGFYLGGSAGLNSIRIEAEYLNKKGWSYSAGYDLISKSPVIGIRRKIF